MSCSSQHLHASNDYLCQSQSNQFEIACAIQIQQNNVCVYIKIATTMHENRWENKSKQTSIILSTAAVLINKSYNI